MSRGARAVVTAMLVGQILLTFAASVKPGSDPATTVDVKSGLLNSLLSNYDQRVLPQNNDSQPVNFSLGIRLLNIVELFEHEEVLETGLYLQQMWTDERLTWDPSRHRRIYFLHVPVAQLWHPHLYIYNNADVEFRQLDTMAVVYSNGHVFYSPRAQLRTRCDMDMTKFPFDTQTCTLKLGSYMYDGNMVNLSLFQGANAFDLDDYTANNEWAITDTAVKVVTKRYSCCPEPFQHIQFDLKLKRNPVYYSHVFILPAVILAALVPFQFMLPPDSKERLTIGSALLLGCILLITMIQSYLPDAHPTLPYLVQYYCLTLVWISISLVCSAWVINTHNRGPRKTKVPRFVRAVFLKTLKKLVCLSGDSYYPLDEMETISLRELDKPIIGTDNRGKSDGSKLEKDVEEILRQLNAIVVRNAAQGARRDVIGEWYQVALVFDRILCFVFMVIFVMYTCILLK